VTDFLRRVNTSPIVIQPVHQRARITRNRYLALHGVEKDCQLGMFSFAKLEAVGFVIAPGLMRIGWVTVKKGVSRVI